MIKILEESLKRYKTYEYIRDNKDITCEISNTKKLILKLMLNDEETIQYCNKKMLEEKHEVEEAICGKHFHNNMTKREILVNEISQYIYWQTIIAISKNVSVNEFDEEGKIKEILRNVDISKIGEHKEITVKEVILHDLEQINKKDYLSRILE